MRIAGKMFAAGALAVIVSASPALAGPSKTYSCKRDKLIDIPMNFTAVLESAGRLRLSAAGGSDKSGYVAPNNYQAWKVFNASGAEVTRYSEASVVFSTTEFLEEMALEGLVPGSYTVQLTSMDGCGNRASVQHQVAVGAAGAESNFPTVSEPTSQRLSAFGASMFAVSFSADDDTAIRRVTVEANGTTIGQYQYFDGVGFRWWSQFYPEDSTLNQGYSFYVGYPDTMKGQCGVRVTVEDLSGNQSVATSAMCLP